MHLRAMADLMEEHGPDIELLNDYVDLDPAANGAFIMFPDGTVMFTDGSGTDNIVTLPEPPSTEPGDNRIIITVPVEFDDGEGVYMSYTVGLVITLDWLIDLIRAARSEYMYLFLADGNGIIMYHPNHQMIGLPISDEFVSMGGHRFMHSIIVPETDGWRIYGVFWTREGIFGEALVPLPEDFFTSPSNILPSDREPDTEQITQLPPQDEQDTDEHDYPPPVYEPEEPEPTPSPMPLRIEAPFTPHERAIIDAICDAMLAGDYERAIALLSNPDVLEILQTHGGGGTFDMGFSYQFWYLDIFEFAWADLGHTGFVRVIMDKTLDGTGTVMHAHITHHSPHEYMPEALWTSMEHVDGVPNGLWVHSTFEVTGGPVTVTHTLNLVNGYRHGEARMWRSAGGTSVWLYENGFRLPLGTPNEHGYVPFVYNVDGGLYSYIDPHQPVFDEQIPPHHSMILVRGPERELQNFY